jgi:hypothetical protein
MESNQERTCASCGTTNYGVIHHCLKCGANLPEFSSQAETLVEFNGQGSTPPAAEAEKSAPSASLEVISELDHGYTYELTNGITFGRSKNCDIVIESPKVSRQHAQIIQNKYLQWMLVDIDSTNGTFCNDKKISKPTVVYNGDEIQVGNFRFRVIIDKPYHKVTPPSSPSQPSTEVEIQPIKPQPHRKGCLNKTALIILAGFVILVLICGVLYFGRDLIAILF